ncbi:MAG: RNA polymerase sigma factor RpoH [Pseudomonadota bacterium]
MGSLVAIPQTTALLVPEDGLQQYLQQIRKFPMLSAEEEQVLARRWRDDNDQEAAHRLVTSHLRLVAKIAMGYRGYGLPVADLIAEGNVGMMQAVKRYDPERGFRLSTYAMWWIKASINEYILHSWSLVKIGTTAAQKKLFFNLRRIKAKLGLLGDGDLDPVHARTIAQELDVSENDVVAMDGRMRGGDQSLNAPVGSSQDSQMEWQDWLDDDTPSQEEQLAHTQELQMRKAMLGTALEGLDPRERYIIENRKLRDDVMTLEDLSAKFGISRERVRQIETRAMDKLQKSMMKQSANLLESPHDA